MYGSKSEKFSNQLLTSSNKIEGANGLKFSLFLILRLSNCLISGFLGSHKIDLFLI